MDVPSDRVCVKSNAGPLVIGDIAWITPVGDLGPGQEFTCGFELPNDGKTRRVCAMLVIIDDEAMAKANSIVLPPGVML